MAVNVTTASSAGGNRPPALDPGTYPGRLVLVVDLGLQNQRAYKGKEKSPGREISLTYEFSDEFMLDEDEHDIIDKPRWLSESFVLYNRESEKAKSTKRYTALDPNNNFNGDFLKCVGTPVSITVVQNPNTNNPERPYENIAGITPMRPKDVQLTAELVNEAVVFDLEEPDLESFMKIPKWIQKRVMENLEFRGSLLERLLEEGAKGVPELSIEAQGPAIPHEEDDETPY